MEFFALLGILLLIGSIFGWVSFFKAKSLEAQLKQLKNELSLLRRSITNLQKNSSPTTIATSVAEPPEISEIPVEDTAVPESTSVVSKVTEDTPSPAAEIPEPELQPTATSISEQPKPQEPAEDTDSRKPQSLFIDPERLYRQFKDNWMLWTGGLSVALAGVFIAKYAIQYGVLGPVGRVLAGVITGLALHAGAEYLRRKLANNHPSFAMLAAGGSISLFAAMLAALHYYQMFSPTVVFIVLAIVAVATMWLSLIHGPILAAMGMIGAYVLPILVSTGSGNVLVALVYSLIITASILWLLQYVKRPWLWNGMVAGSLFWWLASLDANNADYWRQWYLAVLAYGYLCVMHRDWFLQRSLLFAEGDRFYSINSRHLNEYDKWSITSLLAVVLALIISTAVDGVSAALVPAWIPLSLIVLYAARRQAYLALHAWLCLVGILAGIVSIQLDIQEVVLVNPVLPIAEADFLYNMVLLVVVFSGMAFFNARSEVVKSSWTAMTLVTPILVLLTTYLCLPDYLTADFWAMTGLLLGALYIFLATTAKSKAWATEWQVWLYLSGHFAYTFAAIAYFENGTLTLAIALQTISLAVIIKRFDVPQLGWLLKLVTTVTVIRLSANPWLFDYPTTEHWTIWTYGGSFLAVVLSGYLLTDLGKLKRWLDGAALHLLVLLIWVELRYYLYDGVVFQSEYTFTEASLNLLIFGSLSLIYYYRAQLGQHSQTLYKYYSYFLMLVTLGLYAVIIGTTLSNDISVWQNIGATPIWNIMLIAYGFPVILAVLAMRYYKPSLTRYFEYLAAIAAFLFINFEIRHLWQGSLDLKLATSDGEFYTYSIVWLLAAIATILLGSYRLGRRYYKVGMTMLVMVVIKVFIFDMSQLDGIYRIVAFMGLGLCLLAMAYVHKKLIVVLEERNS